jgi:tight adherence protein B
MNAALVPLLTFGAVAAAIAGAYSIYADLYLRDRTRVIERIDSEFRKRQRERARQALLFKNLNQLASEAGSDEEQAPDLRQRLAAMVEQSGMDLTVEKLFAIAGTTGLSMGLLAGILRQSILLGVLVAVAGGAVPFLVVEFKRRARLEKLLSQLSDAFDLMSRVIRAGQTMAQALQSVADEFPQPIAGEFSFCYEQQNLGLPPEVALRDLARRTGLLDIKIFVTALLVQQQTGGNLAEMLDRLSGIIRQRYRIRGQIRTLTAEGRMQAVILLALPIAMFFMLLAVNPNYEGELLAHPSLIWSTLAFEGIGALWIRKIINFDF